MCRPAGQEVLGRRENLTLRNPQRGGSGLAQVEGSPSKRSWCAMALRVPWHRTDTDAPFGTLKWGLAHMRGFEKVWFWHRPSGSDTVRGRREQRGEGQMLRVW